MNKREVVWLIIRLIGLYFAYSAVVAIFTLASAGYGLYSLSSATRSDSDVSHSATSGASSLSRGDSEPKTTVKADPAAEKLKNEAFRALLLDLLLVAVYGGLGFYLIAKGGILFRVLSNEASAERRREEETVTTLNL
jgi:hypothetical protein